ncbi:MAG: FeoA family protein [Candidatus Margulisiibacteriota bacterium]|jgi:Fe2+ transport system protein FeoA
MSEHQGTAKISENGSRELRLSELRTGESGRILRLVGSGEVHRRLLDMGLVTGTEFKVATVAPLGDPIGLKLRSFSMSLRKEEASKIIVERTNG